MPYCLVAAAFAVNLTFAALSRTSLSARSLMTLQIWLDVVFITGLVYFTGGVGSDFLLLYFGPILAAGVNFRRNSALLVAAASTVGLFFCAGAYYSLFTSEPAFVEQVWIAEGRPEPGALVGVLALQAGAFHLVAFLASALTMRLKFASIQTEQILASLSDGVITVESTGRVVFSNSRASAMLEIDSELVGAEFWDIAPPPARDALHAVLRGGEAASAEISLGASLTPVMVTILPLADHARRLRGANIILHDLTERRRLTEALTRAERLEATSATVASIAHEIRNPLAAIRASAQELARERTANDAGNGLLDLVVNESDRLNRIITDFLNFSRMSKPQLGPLELRGLLDEVAVQLSTMPRGKTARIGVAGAGELWVTGDGEQMRQVFLNLGLNALDAALEGNVLFELARVDGCAEIKTLDDGGGIDDSIEERVFEPFFTTKTGGTGLGLPIARRIVEDHRGSVKLCRNGDGRNCVAVLLPLDEGKSPAGTNRPEETIVSKEEAR
jgi:two-component system sensor histidine kinase PilS (NtrC family)